MAADRVIPADSTSKMIEVMVRDSTTGQGKTGLAYGSVTFSYWREGAATGVTATCVNAALGTWTTKGWKEVDATNQKGVYQFGVPDAALALAAGVGAVTINFQATGMLDKSVEILLSNPIRGLGDPTALPLCSMGGGGGLSTYGDLAGTYAALIANLPAVIADAMRKAPTPGTAIEADSVIDTIEDKDELPPKTVIDG